MPCDLSIVVSITEPGKCADLDRCLTALEPQIAPPDTEIIVPFIPGCDQIGDLHQRHCCTQFVATIGPSCGGGPNPGLNHLAISWRRAQGLAAAKGEVIALLEDHTIPSRSWCADVRRRHSELPYAAIGGSVEPVSSNYLSNAISICDFGRYSKQEREGLTRCLTDINVSYKRRALAGIRKIWGTLYDEASVHAALLAQSDGLWFDPALTVQYARDDLNWRRALRERRGWGRIFAGNRFLGVGMMRRAFYAMATLGLPPLLFSRAIRRGSAEPSALMLLTMFGVICAWSLGEFVGYATGKPCECAMYRSFEPARFPNRCKRCVLAGQTSLGGRVG
jgi:hypothetical protein